MKLLKAYSATTQHSVAEPEEVSFGLPIFLSHWSTWEPAF
jgi:hypothetical protein